MKLFWIIGLILLGFYGIIKFCLLVIYEYPLMLVFIVLIISSYVLIVNSISNLQKERKN